MQHLDSVKDEGGRMKDETPGPVKGVVLGPIWTRRPMACSACVLLFGLSLLGRSGSAGGDDERYHGRVFDVLRVVDGDTVDLDVADGASPWTRVRLWGIDAPETGGSPGGPMYFGPEAEVRTGELLAGRQVRVELNSSRTRGKYGRLLAYLYIESTEVDLAESLLEEGYAYADWRFDHPLRSRYKAVERTARANRQGLWRDVSKEQTPVWRQRILEHFQDDPQSQ
jgi:endonuclease YncB( thermonuclease family)